MGEQVVELGRGGARQGVYDALLRAQDIAVCTCVRVCVCRRCDAPCAGCRAWVHVRARARVCMRVCVCVCELVRMSVSLYWGEGKGRCRCISVAGVK